MVERNRYPTKRTKRAHGVRKQDAEAMRQFEYDSEVNPPKIERMIVRVLPACTCDAHLHPHIHPASELEKAKRQARPGW